MRNILIGIACAVALVVGRFAVHAYYVHQAENDAMDAYVDARLSQPLSVPLDCPPLGQQAVTFGTEDATPDMVAQNAPAIQKHWSEIWPEVYKGIQDETNDWKEEEKHKLSESVKIELWIPAQPIADNPSWTIQYECPEGTFTTEVKGLVVGQTQIN